MSELGMAPLDAELVLDMTEDEATAITGRIRAWVNAFPAEDVKRAYQGRIWVALAYDSWAEWCECELDGFKLPAVERREIVAELASTNIGTDDEPAYMSNEAIADVIGVDEITVRRDVASTPTNVGVQLKNRPTLGKDGKVRQPAAKPPSPPALSSPRRKPLNDVARELTIDLMRINKRLAKLADDDRFSSNKETIGCFMRHEVSQGREILDRIDTAINPSKPNPAEQIAADKQEPHPESDSDVIDDPARYAKSLMAAYKQTFAPHRLQQLDPATWSEFLAEMKRPSRN